MKTLIISLVSFTPAAALAHEDGGLLHWHGQPAGVALIVVVFVAAVHALQKAVR